MPLMKCPPFLMAILALLGLELPCSAQDDGEQAPRMVSVQLDYIEVSHEQLLDLLFTGAPPSADATPLRKKLQGMIQTGQAKLLETTQVSTRSGIKAGADSQREWIYPTEFEPWAVPRDIDPPGTPQRLTQDELRGLEVMVMPMTPTSFETRNLGSFLEAEPSVTDENVQLRLSSSLVWPTGRTLVAQRKDSGGNEGKAELPEIYSMSLDSSLSCPPGRHVLAAVLSPMDAHGATDPSRKVMVFAKCGVAGARPGPLGDVLVSVHVAEMPQALAAELASAEMDGNALFKKSRELVKAGRAKLFETSVLRVPSGSKGTVESVQEHISTLLDDSSCSLSQAPPAQVPPQTPPPTPSKSAPQIRLPDLPTSFETRHVGNSCEIIPTLSGGSVEMNGSWEFDLNPGDRILEEWKDSLGNGHQTKMPVYLTFKASLGRSLAPGKWQLVSVQDSTDSTGKIDPSRKLVVFLRADPLESGATK